MTNNDLLREAFTGFVDILRKTENDPVKEITMSIINRFAVQLENRDLDLMAESGLFPLLLENFRQETNPATSAVVGALYELATAGYEKDLILKEFLAKLENANSPEYLKGTLEALGKLGDERALPVLDNIASEKRHFTYKIEGDFEGRKGSLPISKLARETAQTIRNQNQD